MAKLCNEKYGIVSCSGEVQTLRRMGVKECNMANIANCNVLFSRMMAGDTLCVPNVKAFAVGAYDLVDKMLYLSHKRIAFNSDNEKCLNFSPTKVLPFSTVQVLKNLAQREQEFVLSVQNCKCSNDIKIQLISRIRYEYLTMLVLIFCNNGIRNKRN